MTLTEKANMFSKEVLNIKDFMQMFDCCADEARDKMNYVRAHSRNRPVKQGTVHVEDYFEAYKINPQRFCIFIESKELNLAKKEMIRTVLDSVFN